MSQGFGRVRYLSNISGRTLKNNSAQVCTPFEASSGISCTATRSQRRYFAGIAAETRVQIAPGGGGYGRDRRTSLGVDVRLCRALLGLGCVLRVARLGAGPPVGTDPSLPAHHHLDR